MATIDYQQRDVVSTMHQFPRFGHSKSLATLASWPSNESIAVQDYSEGIIAFCVFLSLLFCVWGLILIVLTLNYGVDRVGCAAGGEVVDVGALRQAKVSRAERKRRIVRAWRLQSVFLLASLLLPTFSFLLINRGLIPFVASLEGLVDVNDQVDAKAYRGIEIADSMTAHYQDLKSIPIVDIQSFCPNANAIDADASDLLDGLGMYELSETIQSGLATVDSFVIKYLNDIRPGLVQVTDATRMIDRGIDSVHDSDWLLKLLLVALNIVNGFFIFGVFLSKISVIYSAFQAMLTYLLIPLFCLLLLGSIAATCAAISVALTNADFCAGGSLPGSPIGTIQDMVAEYGYSEDSLTFRSVAYYTQGCLEDNPLAFIADFKSQVAKTSETVSAIIYNMQSYNITELSEECGTDVQPVNITLQLFAPVLNSLHGNARAATKLSECSNIEPIVRQLAQGPTCNDSVAGLTWIFACLLTISVLGMVILSTRAALFNSVLQVKRLKRREKEFEEYKEYMETFYDTSMWKLDADKKLCNGLRVDLAHAETFETEETSTTSSPREFEENQPVAAEATATRSTRFEAAWATEEEEDDDDDDYSYGSSSEEEDSVSDAGSRSTMTNLSHLLSRFFTVKKDDHDGVSFAQPSDTDSLHSKAWNDQELSPSLKGTKESSPSFATPRRRHRSLLNNTTALFRSPDHHHIPVDELQPLSPPIDENRQQPKAPQKGLKQLRRTNGAAKLC